MAAVVGGIADGCAFQEAEVRQSRQAQEGVLHLEAQVRSLPAADARRGNPAGRLHRQATQAGQGRVAGSARTVPFEQIEPGRSTGQPADRINHMHRLSGFMRTYWTRGEPGRATPRSLTVFMQRMWLAALTFKLLGSSWDVSWHFKWLRDDLAG